MAWRMSCSGLIFLVLISAVGAEEWPAWRGPRLDGTSLETNIPIRWSSSENVFWKVPIPGKGHSSPIIWGDHIFLTTCVEKEQKRLLLCLDRRTGKVLWECVVLTAKLEDKHRLNSFASSTPVTDGQHIWVSFLEYPRMVIACFTVDGKEVWRTSPGEFHSRHGYCSSPILYKDMVIVNGDQDAEAWIVALDQATGKERWRADRPNRTRSYCVPIIIEAAGRKQLVLSGSKCVASYDPDTGKQIWIIDGPTEQFVASLVFQNGILFLTGGFPDYHLMGIKPDGQGDVTKTHVIWHHTRGAAYVPSPIAHDKFFYVVTDMGVGSCLDVQTGKRLWMERLGRHHSASPVAAGGHLYFLDDDGKMFVVKGTGKFEVVAKNDLQEECYASPAISRGQLFIRTLGHLYCIGQPRE